MTKYKVVKVDPKRWKVFNTETETTHSMWMSYVEASKVVSDLHRYEKNLLQTKKLHLWNISNIDKRVRAS